VVHATGDRRPRGYQGTGHRLAQTAHGRTGGANRWPRAGRPVSVGRVIGDRDTLVGPKRVTSRERGEEEASGAPAPNAQTLC